MGLLTFKHKTNMKFIVILIDTVEILNKYNPNAQILEKCKDNEVDEKYEYWFNIINYKPAKEIELKYVWQNKKTGHIRYSIYPHLSKYENSEEWQAK